jgi:RNA polymerase sigma-70 factor (ECF subfamily)
VARLDEAAFGDFYRRTSRDLWAYVYRVTGNSADADDIVQEAFCRLLRADGAGTLKLAAARDEEGLRRYLYRAASNLVVDRWRKGKREAEAKASHRPMSTQQRRDEEGVASTFARLQRRDRLLLWLAYVEEEGHEEIAASLGLQRGSIKVLLFRAKRRLRELLKR